MPTSRPSHLPADEPLAVAGQRRDQRADERHGRDQQPGQRARELRLRAREQHPGIAISIAREGEQGRQRGKSGRSSPRAAAIGSSSSAADRRAQRRRASPGASSRTATRIRRYGIPQITHIAANSSSAAAGLVTGIRGSVSTRATKHRDDGDHDVVRDAPLADRVDARDLRPEEIAAERNAREGDHRARESRRHAAGTRRQQHARVGDEADTATGIPAGLA